MVTENTIMPEICTLPFKKKKEKEVAFKYLLLCESDYCSIDQSTGQWYLVTIMEQWQN